MRDGTRHQRDLATASLDLHPVEDMASERTTELSGNGLGGGLIGSSLKAEPLAEFLHAAWEANGAYQPPAYGRPYRTPMWEFVRRARGHPTLGLLSAFEAATLVERTLHTWPDCGRKDPWQTWFPQSDDGKAEFLDTWERIKWPRAELDRAQAEAAKLPLQPTVSCSPQYDRFVSVAGHLQRGVDGPILLPCVKFSEILRCTPMTVSRYRRLAVQYGLLKLASKGIKAQRKADEFIFNVDLFDWKTGKQITSENLNLCVTPSPECYTEIQEKERKQEFQDKQEKKETQEMQRETRARLPEKTKCAIRQGPYIPTTIELAHELQKTVHLRTLRVISEIVPNGGNHRPH